MTHTTKHTPGPWVVNADGRMIEAQLPNLRNEYEHICDLRGGIKGQINLGNAHLIAAAPAMYEALKALHSVLDQRMPDGRTLNQHLSQEVFECFYGPAIAARAAIAKAEGA